MSKKLALALLVGVVIGWLFRWGSYDQTYTLYRDSATDANAKGNSAMRIHVASFDSADGAAYNQENCNQARKLFQEQPEVTVRYWCEKGRFKP